MYSSRTANEKGDAPRKFNNHGVDGVIDFLGASPAIRPIHRLRDPGSFIILCPIRLDSEISIQIGGLFTIGEI